MTSRALATISILMAIFAALVACEDTLVVVTPLGGGGQGGSGGTGGEGGAKSTTTTTTTTVSNMGGGCQGQAPVGALTFCGGSAVTGTGGALECFWCVQDEAGSQWEASCAGDACECLLNGAPLCGCSQPGGGCASGACCPPPWSQPF